MPSEKSDLSDVTFVVPVSVDLPARLRNLRIVVEWLLGRFDTTVLVSEYDAEPKLRLDGWPEALRARVRHRFFPNPDPHFRKARALNLAVREVETPFFAMHDTDVLLHTRQYLDGVEKLREGECEMCLPYENRVMWIPRDDVPALREGLADAALASLHHELSDDSYRFVGLVNLFETRAFLEAGMMNEHFRSWGYEDVELYDRFRKLGYRVVRTGGRAYHLGHGNGGDTGPRHPHFLDNREEYERVVSMEPAELREYVAGWAWRRAALHAGASAG